MRDFREQLKRKAAANTAATGIPHEYVPVDPRDKDQFNVSAEGAEISAAIGRGARLDKPKPKRDTSTQPVGGAGEPPPLIGEKT